MRGPRSWIWLCLSQQAFLKARRKSVLELISKDPIFIYISMSGSLKSANITFNMVGSAGQPSGPGWFRTEPPMKNWLQESAGWSQAPGNWNGDWQTPPCLWLLCHMEDQGGQWRRRIRLLSRMWEAVEESWGCLLFCLHVSSGSALAWQTYMVGENDWRALSNRKRTQAIYVI